MSNITISANSNHNVVDATAGEDDGQIHSLPHKKHGPYTCPRCDKVFPKSQSFSAHMANHYKDETKEEKMRRLVCKTKKRTWVPISFQAEPAVPGNTSRRRTHRHAPMDVKEEKVEQDTDQVQRTTLRTLDHIKDHLGPPPGFEGHPRYGDAKTTERTLNHNNDHFGPPPGFEGHSRYGDAKIKSEPCA